MEHSVDFPTTSQIPVDLIIWKNPLKLTWAGLTVKDANGNLVFKVQRRSSGCKRRGKRLLVDANNNPVISIHRNAFRGDSEELKDLIFKVKATLHSRLRSELEVFLVGENGKDIIANFEVKGSPLQRSCTIYKGNSIVAQTSAMYKLQKVIVERYRFRLTIYPGIDQNFVVGMIAIFFCGGYNEENVMRCYSCQM
ncbi:protein LURP-one-related 7-like isoform X2 [Aristolochia californica]|uniref:protein LURP-one-related 7-like isoform X2 n=1 Tax=Aristolochia californica TaxID=171875 RepID=UPI0035D55F23